MRIPFIAGNWKMNKTRDEALAFAGALKELYKDTEVKTAICAPFVHIEALKKAFEGTDIKVGAQNVHYEDSGAFTGEVSAPMLTELGVDYCIIGHSERREYFGETDETVNRKLLKLFYYTEIIPILCVGENLSQREAGKEQEIVREQLQKDLADLSEDDIKKLVIAYEPIWAIGTGKTASPEQAQEMCGFIRGEIRKQYGDAAADAVTIQYGGSMKPDNAAELMAQPDIDGGLIGGASLVAADFIRVIKY